MSGIIRRLFGGDPDDADEREDDEGAGQAYGVRLVLGLGNPGSKYAGNRRNVGFWVCNRLARKHGLDFSTKTSSYGLADGRINGHNIAIAKLRTYNNEAGTAATHLIRRLKLDHAAEMLVVSDHLDLPAGKVRIRRKGGGGGQKGMSDIIAKTKTDEFPRLRIGIGRPAFEGEPTRAPDMVADWVLSDPTPEERALLDTGVERAIEAIECALTDGIEAAMNRYNRD